MLQVIVRDVQPGNEAAARTIGTLVIRDDQSGTSVLGRMLVHRQDQNGDRSYMVTDHQIRNRDLWSLIAYAARAERGRSNTAA